MIPIYLKDEDFETPPEPIYYLLAQQGLFLVKRNDFFESAMKVEGIPWLVSQEEGVLLTLPLVPGELLLQALAFFRTVYSRYRTEAIALLVFREDLQVYDLIIPHQTVGGGHCEYELRDTVPGARRLGTIHSHAGMEAFHSEMDNSDERYEDGFHITMGNIDAEITLSCSVVVQGQRQLIPPEAIFSPYPLPFDQVQTTSNWERLVDEKVSPLPRPIEFGP